MHSIPLGDVERYTGQCAYYLSLFLFVAFGFTESTRRACPFQFGCELREWCVNQITL